MIGFLKLTKNNNPDEYAYSDYGIGFNAPLHISLLIREWGEIVFIFDVYTNSSRHTDNTKKIC